MRCACLEKHGEPDVYGGEADAIAAALELFEKRDRWLKPEGASPAEFKKRTLANLYNERPVWFDLAHRKLNAAVAVAYSWSADLTDDAILERLLALNLGV